MDLHGSLSGKITGTFNGPDYANVIGGKVTVLSEELCLSGAGRLRSFCP